MAKVVSFWSLKISFLLAISLFSHSLLGQLIVTDTISFNQSISSSSVDRVGNLYLAFEDGTITQYNSELDSVVSFNPTKTGEITLLEAWHGFQIFAFYEEFQEFQLLNRFLTQETRYYLPDIISDYANLSTYSGNQNLWVYNESGFKLLKVNTYTSEVLIENPLDFIIEDESEIVFMKEYQNKLFLLSKDSDIYIFDNLGNYLNKIEAPQIIDFSFKRNEIYYLDQSAINSLDLYKGSETKTLLPPTRFHQIEIFGENTLLLFEENKIYVVNLKK